VKTILIGLVSASLAACKGESKPPPAPPATDAQPSAPADAATPTPDSAPTSLDAEIRRANLDKLRDNGPWPGFVSQEIEVISGDAFSGDIGAKLDYAYWEGVKACYDAALKQHPGITGRVLVTFTVAKHGRDENGRVTNADAKGFDPDIDACIETKARRWSFHLMEGGPATFKVPIELNRKVPPPPVY
jgi:outer membrane biosynthesis protein TonB